MYIIKFIAKIFPEQLKKYLSGKFYKYLTIFQIRQFDRYRKTYNSLTFKNKVKLASKWLLKYPEQVHFKYGPVEHWFKYIVQEPAFIMEIGGWRGDLALKALRQFDQIKLWHNYDLLKSNENQKCSDERYRLISLDDYLWNKTLEYNYNALIATHMIEHLSLQELKKLIKWIPQKITTVLFEAPLPLSSDNINWKGDHSSHVLEKGWQQVIGEMKKNGFTAVYSEDNSYIFNR